MRSLVVMLAVGALLCSSIAFAAPRALSSAELDQVAAGAGAADLFVNAFTAGALDSSTDASGTTDPATSTGTGSPTVAGSDNTTAGAVADNGSDALDGTGNIALDLTQNGNIAVDGAAAGDNNTVTDQSGSGVAVQTGDIAISLTDAFKTTTTTYTNGVVGNGNATFIGDNNTVNMTSDNSDLSDWQIAGSSYGVIAEEATVTDSFNTTNTTNNIAVTITDSFNVVTNTLDISGQGTVSGIINANSLGFQNIGANLNITTATSSVPNTQPAPTGTFTLEGFGAAAVTYLDQTVVNGSLGVIVGDVNVAVAVGGTVTSANIGAVTDGVTPL